MKKKLKRKCILSGIFMMVGIVILLLSFQMKNLTEFQRSYMNGFGASLFIASFVLFLKNRFALGDPETLRKREIELNDERFQQISTKAMAITFKIGIKVEGIASIILALLNYEFSVYFGILVGVQLIIYCICNTIISKKI